MKRFLGTLFLVKTVYVKPSPAEKTADKALFKDSNNEIKLSDYSPTFESNRKILFFETGIHRDGNRQQSRPAK